MAVPRRPARLNVALRRLAAAVAAACVIAGGAQAADAPGRFDYWVLALSWSPQFCNNKFHNEQCLQPRAFAVHGLWPQHERGYPDYCRTDERVPDDLVERMMPIMPGRDLVQRQWRKHGSCSGLPAKEYFLNVERAWRRIVIPALLNDVPTRLETSLNGIERAFIDVNPKLQPDGIALQCSGSWLREIRICLDRDFDLRACGDDVADRCGKRVLVRPTRE